MDAPRRQQNVAYGGPHLKTLKMIIETSNLHRLNHLGMLVSKISKIFENFGAIHKKSKKLVYGGPLLKTPKLVIETSS